MTFREKLEAAGGRKFLVTCFCLLVGTFALLCTSKLDGGQFVALATVAVGAFAYGNAEEYKAGK